MIKNIYWILLFYAPLFFIFIMSTGGACIPASKELAILCFILLISFLIVSLFHIRKKGMIKSPLTVLIILIAIIMCFLLATTNYSNIDCNHVDGIIKADLDLMRIEAENYKALNNRYSLLNYNIDASSCDIANTFIATETDADKACDEALSKIPGGMIIRINNSTGNDAKYCIQKKFITYGSFCVDSTGYIGLDSNYNDCDNINFTCKED
jgi:hypothetical protein